MKNKGLQSGVGGRGDRMLVTALKGIKGASRIIRRSANLLSLLPYGRAFLGYD